jgi:hypothetical protein
VERLVRSPEVGRVLRSALTTHIDRIRTANLPDEEEEPYVKEDLSGFSTLRSAVQNGFKGYVTRDVVLRRKEARINFTHPQDVQPADPSMLRLVNGEGRQRSVEEIVVNIRELPPGSPTHRPGLESGHTVRAEATALRGGAEIEVATQRVSFNPRTERVSWDKQVGVGTRIRDDGTVTAMPRKYTGRVPYSTEDVQDLTQKHSQDGRTILRKIKDILF